MHPRSPASRPCDLIYAPEIRYLDEILPGLRSTLASSSIQAQRAIMASGGGVGILPCFMSEGLVLVLGDAIALERRLWLGTHREVHGTARGKAVCAWLRQLVRDHQDDPMPFG